MWVKLSFRCYGIYYVLSNTITWLLQDIFMVNGWTGIAQSVQRLATGWNCGRGEIFCTRQDGSWSPPSLLHAEYRVFPGVKVVGAWRGPSAPIQYPFWRKSRAVFKFHLCAFMTCYRANSNLYLLAENGQKTFTVSWIRESLVVI